MTNDLSKPHLIGLYRFKVMESIFTDMRSAFNITEQKQYKVLIC